MRSTSCKREECKWDSTNSYAHNSDICHSSRTSVHSR